MYNIYLNDKRTPIDRKDDNPDIIEQCMKCGEENPADRKGKCFYVPADEIKANNYDSQFPGTKI
jgi:type I restriction enzyme M protein